MLRDFPDVNFLKECEKEIISTAKINVGALEREPVDFGKDSIEDELDSDYLASTVVNLKEVAWILSCRG